METMKDKFSFLFNAQPKLIIVKYGVVKLKCYFLCLTNVFMISYDLIHL